MLWLTVGCLGVGVRSGLWQQGCGGHGWNQMIRVVPRHLTVVSGHWPSHGRDTLSRTDILPADIWGHLGGFGIPSSVGSNLPSHSLWPPHCLLYPSLLASLLPGPHMAAFLSRMQPHPTSPSAVPHPSHQSSRWGSIHQASGSPQWSASSGASSLITVLPPTPH